jgi:cyanophycinase
VPSPVPAGYTRGPIFFTGALTAPAAEARLLQRFWAEAGGFGARLVLVPAGGQGRAAAEHYRAVLQGLESDSVEIVDASTRAAARLPENAARVQAATGILLAGPDVLRLAGTIGGTPLAQAIRRANAQGKAVAGVGPAAAILCQHMLAGDPGGPALATGAPYTRRRAVAFAPGLGIVNRVVLDAAAQQAGRAEATEALARLVSAVAHNPFLVGVSLDADTGAALYADTTMDIFGEGGALVVDGAHFYAADLLDAAPGAPFSVAGIELHGLTRGYTFNFDTRRVRAPEAADASLQTEAVKAAF